MKTAAGVALLVAALAPALAVPVPVAALDIAECGTIEEQATTALNFHFRLEVYQTGTSVATALDDGCATTDVEIITSAGLPLIADRVLFTGAGLMDWVRGDVILPPRLRVEVDGLRVQNSVALAPREAWLGAMLGDGATTDLALDWRWNDAAQRLDLRRLTAVFDDDNRITLSGSAQTDGTWQPYATPWAALGVDTLDLRVRNSGLFRAAVADPFVALGALPSAEALSFLGLGLWAYVDQAPETMLDAASKEALRGVLAALPDADGVLHLRLASPQPLNPERVWADLRTGLPLDRAMLGATLEVDWTPTSAP